MLKHFGRFVIGGRSGKREQAWLVFLLWCGTFAWAVHRETAGAPLDGTMSILTSAFPLVIANLALAHGMEWVSTQTKFGNEWDGAD